MPRAKGTQKPATAPEQVYGQGAELINAQKAVPLANLQESNAPARGVQTSTPSPGGQAAGPPMTGGAGAAPFADAISAASAMPPVTGTLGEPSGQPMTTGMPFGAGANTLMLPGADNLFLQLAEQNNDPWLIKLAQRARQMGMA